MPGDIDLSQFQFTGLSSEKVEDLNTLSEEEKERLVMSGIDVTGAGRSGSFLQVDHDAVHCKSDQEGVEILDIKEALEKYDGLDGYYWTQVDPDKDEFTRAVADNLHGGYYIRAAPGVQVEDPVQSCLFIKANKAGQNVHNVVIVEEGASLHIITGCSVAHGTTLGAHLGISEFFVKKNASLTFTMVHNWGENVTVRPRTGGVVEENGVFINNYVLMKPVKDLQSYPTIRLAGRGGVCRFNSVLVAPEGSYLDTGSRIIMDAPDTRGEIVSRTITTGGTIIARGDIQASYVPARGHLECKGLILGKGIIHAIPELKGAVEGVELSHEAAVGKIAQEEIEYLMARGLDEDEATSTIVRGFLNVDIMGLPKRLNDAIQKTIEESEKDMF
ncbi:MAG: SufB/SufD family protein [Desulfovibrionaceae bacterium]